MTNAIDCHVHGHYVEVTRVLAISFVVCMRPHSVMASGSDERKYNPPFNYGGFESILIAVSQYNTIVKYLRVKCLNTSPSRSFCGVSLSCGWCERSSFSTTTSGSSIAHGIPLPPDLLHGRQNEVLFPSEFPRRSN